MAGKQVFAALQAVQRELKAPKGQFNNFGKYHYRSCEDIVEAVKPLLNANGLILLMSDEVIQVGERVYIKATCKVVDVANGESIEVSAMAREASEKKGMDPSQVTGTASSYARKYALNGLFAIDDCKDADTDEHKKQTEAVQKEAPKQDAVRKQAINKLNEVIKAKGLTKDFLTATAEKVTGKKSTTQMTAEEIMKLTEALEFEP